MSENPFYMEFGGSSGDKFDDYDHAKNHGLWITSIEVYCGVVVDGIKIYYGTSSAGLHGSTGGQSNPTATIQVGTGSYLTQITGTVVDYSGISAVGNLMLTLNDGSTYGPYGDLNSPTVAQVLTFTIGGDGLYVKPLIVALRGRAASFLTALGGDYEVPTS